MLYNVIVHEHKKEGWRKLVGPYSKDLAERFRDEVIKTGEYARVDIELTEDQPPVPDIPTVQVNRFVVGERGAAY